MSPVASSAVQIVDIPLAKIRPNPKNPGPPITEEQIAELAENLEAEGLLNPIKVMPDSEKGDGYWVILAGERRYRAFLQLKRETIPAYLLNPTPAEAVKITHLDNAVRDRGWWADYQSIGNLHEADPNLTLRQLGAGLKMNKDKVGRALSLLPLLNPDAKALLVRDSDKGNKGNKGISELAAAELAGLATDRATSENQAMVHRALAEAIHQNLTQVGVRGLVQWVKQGNRPEDYQTRQAAPKTTQAVQPVKATPAPTPAQVGSPSSSQVPKATPASSDGLKELVMGGFGGVLGGFLASNLKRALGTLVRRYMLHGLAALGVLAFLGFHGVGNFFKPKPANSSVTSPATEQTAPAPQAPQKAVPAPVHPRSAKVKKGQPQQLASAPVSTGSTDSIPAWTPEGLPLAKDFAERFYSVSPGSWDDNLSYFKAHLTDGYAPVFVKQYYPDARKYDLQNNQEVQYFSNAQAPVVVGGQGNSAKYRVQGQITLQNRAGRTPQNVWTKPVALEIAVRHVDGMGYRVEKVTVVAPKTAEKSTASGQVNTGDQTAKFVGDAAKTVGDSADAAQKVKNLLGL